eukprot:m51a1_g12351 putative lipopolysaccharide-induced tumor necrosis factor-alpha factor homolog (145) ;mRNA; f:541876-542464
MSSNECRPYDESMPPCYPMAPSAAPQYVVDSRVCPPYVYPVTGSVMPAQPYTLPAAAQGNAPSGQGFVFREMPVKIRCQFCSAVVVTLTKHRSGLLVWMVAGGMCIVGLVFGCCLIPFCIKDLKDVHHECPSCRRTVGVYHRIQ